MKKKLKKLTRWDLIFIVFLILLVANIIIPDPIPFIDEILMGIITVLSADKALDERK